MQHFFSLIQSVLLLIILVSSSFWLKKRGIIGDEQRGAFSKITTDYVLPSLVFANLAMSKISYEQFIPVFIMLGAILLSMAIGYFVGKLLKLKDDRLGVFIVLTGFGSSSSLGYPLIKEVFPGSIEAMTDALIIGELGACLPFFIFGVAILLYFGQKKEGRPGFKDTLIPFLKSPIFIAVAAGLAFSLIGLPENNIIVKFIENVFNTIGASLMVFVAISIGLMLKPINMRTIYKLIVAIAVIKLVAEPLIALAGISLLGVPEIESEVLLIEAAMPSGAIATVVAERYGCDGEFASVVVIATYLIGIFTIPVMFFFGIL